MKKINCLFKTLILIFLIISSLTYNISALNKDNSIINVGVLLYNSDDYYISQILKSLEEIEKENTTKVHFNFFDAKGNQDLQNKQLNEILKGNYDLILLNIVNIKETQNVIDKVKETNIPLISFNREPLSLDSIKSYGKALYVGTNGSEAGKLQGDIVIKLWNDKKIIDKNSDNKIQYIMLKGEKDNIEAQQRTEYSIRTINQNGINTYALESIFCNWEEECAKDRIKSLFLKYGENIELIIANNDAMAIGSISALQEYGYNKGNPRRYINVIGVDGLDKAKNLIAEGFMAGTVVQDADAMAKALYDIGMNLVSGNNPLSNTSYSFDNSGVAVRIPYKGYIINTF